jgi:small subunit ribosomal protein S19
MSRSKWKGPFVDVSVLKLKKKLTAKSKKVWSRSSQIPSFLLGKTISVYNGKEFKPVLVTSEKIGFKFGDFSITRKYGNKLKNSKLKNKK